MLSKWPLTKCINIFCQNISVKVLLPQALQVLPHKIHKVKVFCIQNGLHHISE